MSEIIRLTHSEIDRVSVIHQVIARKLTVPHAAALLHLSPRQVQRLCRRLETRGPAGLAHQLRGRPSNHHVPQEVKEQALALIRAHYSDFGPTFATEKLATHGIQIGTETVRRLMTAQGVWTPHARKPRHRAWRERRACYGELIQADGSHHRWFEDRAPACVLIAFIDDATSKVPYALFTDSESTEALMQATWAYVEQEGRPMALYVDKDSIFITTRREPTIEEQLRDRQPETQYARALGELEIEILHAHSPQAKGRIERLFGTFQNRLVKELRLKGISTCNAANQFLWDTYLTLHNQRFAVPPTSPTNVHRPLLPTHHLPAIFSIQEVRRVRRDFTLQWQGQWLQLEKDQPVPVFPNTEVLVEQRLDHSLYLRVKGQYLRFHLLPARPSVPTPPPTPRISKLPRRSRYKPPPDHPWRKPLFPKKRTFLLGGKG